MQSAMQHKQSQATPTKQQQQQSVKQQPQINFGMELRGMDLEPLPFDREESSTFDLDFESKDAKEEPTTTTHSASASIPALAIQPPLERQDSWDLGGESPRPATSNRFNYLTASFKG
jgi:hypothetical protein